MHLIFGLTPSNIISTQASTQSVKERERERYYALRLRRAFFGQTFIPTLSHYFSLIWQCQSAFIVGLLHIKMTNICLCCDCITCTHASLNFFFLLLCFSMFWLHHLYQFWTCHTWWSSREGEKSIPSQASDEWSNLYSAAAANIVADNLSLDTFL